MKTVNGITYYRKRGWKVLGAPYSAQLPITPPAGRDICTPFIHWHADGRLELVQEYAWDGASGPTWDTKSCLRAALWHDVHYQLMRLELLPQHFRATADELLRATCIADGMWEWRANLWYRKVRKHGAASARPLRG